jgi:hypothetical protein
VIRPLAKPIGREDIPGAGSLREWHDSCIPFARFPALFGSKYARLFGEERLACFLEHVIHANRHRAFTAVKQADTDCQSLLGQLGKR